MSNPDTMRLHLAQARLHVRRAQNAMDHEPRLRSLAIDECEEACALIDYVMKQLAQVAATEASP